jgi:hypothetical protein
VADVFISYSRKDKDFVLRLDEALKRREREACVDWEGIQPTEEFMQAIYGAKGIREASSRMCPFPDA